MSLINTTTEFESQSLLGAVDPVDLAAVQALFVWAGYPPPSMEQSYAVVGLCLGLKAVRDGHTCINFSTIENWLPHEPQPLDAGTPDWTVPSFWVPHLRRVPELVGEPGDRKPFILDGYRLYVARTWHEEKQISLALTEGLEQQRVRLLLGGPGTGKTTRMACELAERLQAALDGGVTLPRVALVAPTGKAAARMGEAIGNALRVLNASPTVIAKLEETRAQTIHQLLDYNPQADARFPRTQQSPLPYDLVIVDETSMVSSSLMYRLLVALPPTATLYLIGDPDQLASIDAGSVLGDIGAAVTSNEAYRDRFEILSEVHRTDSEVLLGLAQAIKRGDFATVLQILSDTQSGSIRWIPSTEPGAVAPVLEDCVQHASRVKAEAEYDGSAALRERLKLQVLCAHRAGATGVAGWNAEIEQRLGVLSQNLWYVGRPIMVTRNNRSLRLANGDVGVVARHEGDRIAVFGAPDSPVCVPISRLEDTVTVHALTIHKSQGSEYDRVIVVLPERPSRIVTRELLYTAVTRAKRTVTIIGSQAVIETAIATQTCRSTGLAERIGVHL